MSNQITLYKAASPTRANTALYYLDNGIIILSFTQKAKWIQSVKRYITNGYSVDNKTSIQF